MYLLWKTDHECGDLLVVYASQEAAQAAVDAVVPRIRFNKHLVLTGWKGLDHSTPWGVEADLPGSAFPHVFSRHRSEEDANDARLNLDLRDEFSIERRQVIRAQPPAPDAGEG